MNDTKEAEWSEFFAGGVFGSIPQNMGGRLRSSSSSTYRRPSDTSGGGGRRTANSNCDKDDEGGGGGGGSSSSGLECYSEPSPLEECAYHLMECDESTIASIADAVMASCQDTMQGHPGEPPRHVQAIVARGALRMLAHSNSLTRARAYKLLRLLPSSEILAPFREYIDICVSRSLAQYDECQIEREQALMFARWSINSPHGNMATGGTLRLIISIAEHPDDALRSVCLETLCEIAVIRPEEVIRARGLRTLVNAALDGPWAMSVSIVSVLIYILDLPSCRRLLYHGLDLDPIAGALMESSARLASVGERAKIAAFLITQFLKSWSGLQYFLSGNRRVVKTIIAALRLVEPNRKLILGILFEIFGLSGCLDSLRTSMVSLLSDFEDAFMSDFKPGPSALPRKVARSRLYPIEYFRTIVLMVFMDEGLVSALASVVESADAEATDATAILIKWLTQNPHIHLPAKYSSQLYSLQELVDWALYHGSEMQSINAVRLISIIESTDGPSSHGRRRKAGTIDSRDPRKKYELLSQRATIQIVREPSPDEGQPAGALGATPGVMSPPPTAASSAKGMSTGTFPPAAPPPSASPPRSAPPLSSAGSGSAGMAGAHASPAGALPLPPPKNFHRSPHRQMDDEQLVAFIRDSLVLVEEMPIKWNWNAITRLFGDIAGDKKYMEKIFKRSDFMSRLVRFYTPSSHEFSDLPRSAEYEKFVDIGCLLIRALLSIAEGLLLLEKSEILLDIVEELGKLCRSGRDHHHHHAAHAMLTAAADSCFSHPRMQNSLAPAYFKFISEVGKSKEGAAILERHRLFDVYYRLLEQRDHRHIAKYILASLDYSVDGHPKMILSKAAMSPVTGVREVAPHFLKTLVIKHLDSRQEDTVRWAIERLVILLYDTESSVRRAVVREIIGILDHAEAASVSRSSSDGDDSAFDYVLQALINTRLFVDLVPINDIRPLMLRLVASDRGYQFCKEQGAVECELGAWEATEGIMYIYQIELDIAKSQTVGPIFSANPDGTNAVASLDTPATPPHLFGELTKCAAGRALLYESEIPTLLFETLDNICWDSTDPNDILALKATLWALGSIGSSNEGYLMLEPNRVVQRLIEVATIATVLSVKSTCLYALGLLSRARYAAEVFEEHGWVLCYNIEGEYEYAVPPRIEMVLNVSEWATDGILKALDEAPKGEEGEGEEAQQLDVPPDLDPIQKSIIESVVSLNSHFYIKPASRTLAKLRMSHPHYFKLLPLYLQAFKIVSRYRYRLTSHRFIHDMFNVQLAPMLSELVESEGVGSSLTPMYSQQRSNASAPSLSSTVMTTMSSVPLTTNDSAFSRSMSVEGEGGTGEGGRPDTGHHGVAQRGRGHSSPSGTRIRRHFVDQTVH